jgi:hypothetical protein
MEIVLKEVEENYMMPSIAIALLLIYRLCELLGHNKIKE